MIYVYISRYVACKRIHSVNFSNQRKEFMKTCDFCCFCPNYEYGDENTFHHSAIPQSKTQLFWIFFLLHVPHRFLLFGIKYFKLVTAYTFLLFMRFSAMQSTTTAKRRMSNASKQNPSIEKKDSLNITFKLCRIFFVVLASTKYFRAVFLHIVSSPAHQRNNKK